VNERNSILGKGFLGATLALGFAAAVAVWCTWYATHIPYLHLPEQVKLPAVLLAWFAASIWAGVAAPRFPGLLGAGAGFTAAVVGLLLVGTKLTEASASGPAELRPSAAVMVIGFLAAGIAIGLLGGVAGGFLSKQRRETDWLALFAVVAAISVAPLIFIGGMVTSTNSGMAVPDWPNTYGSNMFLFPLGERTRPDVFFEHSHRLFGTLVGLTTLTLMIWVLLAEKRRWVKVVSIVAFLLVCAQGVLGGIRVRQGSIDPAHDQRLLAMLHGVLAQLTFGLLTSLAVFLSPTFKHAAVRRGDPVAGLRRLRFFNTGMLHAMLLQLVIGAAYRHFRDPHALWTHMGLSVLVIIAGAMAGFAAAALPEDEAGLGRVIRRCGAGLIAVVFIQFALGWATFSLGGHELQAGTPAQALLRTAHQANGALLLGVTVVAFLYTRRLIRVTTSGVPGSENSR
jgi:cytochrome c oxidase assembly protein subunit 15